MSSSAGRSGRPGSRDAACALAGAALVGAVWAARAAASGEGGLRAAVGRVLGGRKKRSGSARSRVLAVLPARYASSRFPGKPLAPILGVPMIVRTYLQAKKAKLVTDVVVATDDERIAAACRAAGAAVAMTPESCANGTERAEAAVEALGGEWDIVINVQGDEPLVDPEIIDAVVAALQAAPDAVYSTAATPLAHDEVPLRQRVKVVVDRDDYALYFSRGVIPSNKDGEVRDFPAPYAAEPAYLLHLGLQCYDRAFLREYAAMEPTPLQLMEDLEQLKVLERGRRMKVVRVDHHDAHGVDLPEDVQSVEAVLRRRIQEHGGVDEAAELLKDEP